jgi:putative Ca2+/H+ antiporter (TMEM165/GDT1 family)
MSITTHTLILVTTIGVSVLFLVVFIYSNDIYISKPKQIILPNGTKILQNHLNDHWHDKIKDKIQTTANLGFIHAFIASISVIVVSEIGDKTFFIAAIMAMRHSRLIIYSGAMGALGAMTILSALLGNIVTKFVPRIYTYYLSSFLFACFGIKMLKDGYGMSPDEGTDEYEEVQHEVEKAEAADDLELGGGGTTNNNSTKANPQQPKLPQRITFSKIVTIIRRYISPIFVQAFIMTFLAVSFE